MVVAYLIFGASERATEESLEDDDVHLVEKYLGLSGWGRSREHECGLAAFKHVRYREVVAEELHHEQRVVVGLLRLGVEPGGGQRSRASGGVRGRNREVQHEAETYWVHDGSSVMES